MFGLPPRRTSGHSPSQDFLETGDEFCVAERASGTLCGTERAKRRVVAGTWFDEAGEIRDAPKDE